MTRDQVIERLRAHLSDLVGDAADVLRTDQDIREELDIDSMDFLQVVRAVHADMGVEIPEVDYRRLSTLDAFADYITERG